MAGRKRHSAEQIVRKLEDAGRRLKAGQTIEQMCQGAGNQRDSQDLIEAMQAFAEKRDATI